MVVRQGAYSGGIAKLLDGHAFVPTPPRRLGLVFSQGASGHIERSAIVVEGILILTQISTDWHRVLDVRDDFLYLLTHIRNQIVADTGYRGGDGDGAQGHLFTTPKHRIA